jgi:hypothetical protein
MTTTTSRAIIALVDIMREPEHGRRRRIEACEHLLDYECPVEVIDEAKAVLLSIVEDSETFVDVKLQALKLLRRVEAKKVSPGRTAVREFDIERARDQEIDRRRWALMKAGINPPFPDDAFADLEAADFVPLGPPEPPPTVAGLIAALQKARAQREASARTATPVVTAVRNARAKRGNGVRRRQPKAQPLRDRAQGE